MMQPLQMLLAAEELRAGLVCGMLAAIAVVGLWWGRRPGSPLPLAGPAFAAAAVVALVGAPGLARAQSMPAGAVGGLLLLALGSGVAARLRLPLAAAALLGLPGAVLLAAAAHLEKPGWTTAFVAITAAVAGPLVADFDRTHAQRGLGPLLLLVSIGGLYSTVPDTEAALTLLGAAVPIALLGWPRPLSSLGPAGAAAATGLFAWAAVTGGGARPGSIVGAAGALGLLVTEPLGRRLLPPPRTPPSGRDRDAMVVGVALQAVLAAYAARVAGFEREVGRALLLLMPAIVAGLLLAAALPPPPCPTLAREAWMRHRR